MWVHADSLNITLSISAKTLDHIHLSHTETTLIIQDRFAKSRMPAVLSCPLWAENASL